MKRTLFILAAVAIAFAACKDNEPSVTNNYYGDNSTGGKSISCNPTSKEVPATGETFIVDVTSAAAWTVSTDQPSWVKIDPNTSLGDAYVAITVASGAGGRAKVKFVNASGAKAELSIKRGYILAGALPGKFSVSSTKQVQFSMGNLQYHAKNNVWRFAEHQFDTIGANNKNISATYDGWIDLFGWGTSGYNSKYPYMTSTTASDYGNGTNDIAGTDYDWGKYNPISNGGNAVNQWRTLTYAEWSYLFHGRTNYEKLFALGSVDGINGTILLPDDWILPEGAIFNPSTENGMHWKSGGYDYINEASDANNFADNTYLTSDSTWQVMEEAGAVFLPVTGYRYSTSPEQLGTGGYYWSATMDGTYWAHRMSFYTYQLYLNSTDNRYYGFAVRLVK